MIVKQWIDYLPNWAVFGGTVLLVLASIEAGFRIAVKCKRAGDEAKGSPIGSATGGTLGLLAFLLAITFGMAGSRFEARRELLLDEVNAIGTCYLRAGVTPEPMRDEVQKLLREYVHLRSEALKRPDLLIEAMKRSQVILDELWAQAQLVAQKDPNSEMHALFVDSLNEVIDFHTKRIVVGRYRVPNVIWLALYVIAVLSMASVGYQFGRAAARDWAIGLFLAVAFSIVITLIAALDHSIFDGGLVVNQQPMIELDQKLNAKAP